MAPNTFSFMGREYDTNAFHKETVAFAADWAKRMRLTDPLPEGIDFTEFEDKEIQNQLAAFLAMPKWFAQDVWSAFVANNIVALSNAVKTTDRSQRLALGVYVEVMSLIPNPEGEAYWRKFLRSPQSKGLPNVVAGAFVRGIRFVRPSGPGQICSLLKYMLVWCDPSQGDDGGACVDKELRDRLLETIESLLGQPGIERMAPNERGELEGLTRLLTTLVDIPPRQEDHYLFKARAILERGIQRCPYTGCRAEAELACARCKTTRYCGKAHQTWHWKNGHKLRCYETDF